MRPPSVTAPRSERGSPSVPALRALPVLGSMRTTAFVETASPPPKRYALALDHASAASCVGTDSLPTWRNRPGGPTRTWSDDEPETRPPAARIRLPGRGIAARRELG